MNFVVEYSLPKARFLDRFNVQPVTTGLRTLNSLRAILSSRTSRASHEERKALSEVSRESWERLKHVLDEY